MVAGPVRVQRRRVAGWRMPPGTVYVGRPSKWGNPWRAGQQRGDGTLPPLTAAQAVTRFERWLDSRSSQPEHGVARALILRDLHQLRGKNLACWCPLDQPCHADVLLARAVLLARGLIAEPGPGSRVRDAHGRVWVRTGDTGGSDWELEESFARGGFEPESWVRVCEFAPVTLAG